MRAPFFSVDPCTHKFRKCIYAALKSFERSEEKKLFLIEINRFKEFERRIELTRYSDHVALSLYFSTDKYGLKGFFFCGICIYQFKERKKGNTSKRLILEKDQTEVYERSDHSTMINIKCANRFIQKNPALAFNFIIMQTTFSHLQSIYNSIGN